MKLYINFGDYTFYLYTIEVDFDLKYRPYDKDKNKYGEALRFINYEHFICPVKINDILYNKSIIYVNMNKKDISPIFDLRNAINEYLSEEVLGGLLNFLLQDRNNSIIFLYDDINDRYFNIFYDNELIPDIKVFSNWWNEKEEEGIDKLYVRVKPIHTYYKTTKDNINIYVYDKHGLSIYNQFEDTDFCKNSDWEENDDEE